MFQGPRAFGVHPGQVVAYLAYTSYVPIPRVSRGSPSTEDAHEDKDMAQLSPP